MTTKTAWISLAAAGSLAAGAVVFASSGGSENRGTVIRVVDGDTVDIRVAGAETRVQLLNIDTPEAIHPDKGVECLGQRLPNTLSTHCRRDKELAWNTTCTARIMRAGPSRPSIAAICSSTAILPRKAWASQSSLNRTQVSRTGAPSPASSRIHQGRPIQHRYRLHDPSEVLR
ncbi:thermonuclease family protein [Glutamicibacter sp.]|uniref:thermonuclease family protein n=1 Tax=Glutamicibacter sp. TaxID=1931995 RepID=UPI003D6BF089